MAVKKTGKKTGNRTMVSPRSGAEVPTGNHSGNTGGKKGRSGRKPDAFKQFLRDSLDSEKARKAVETVLEDDKHKAYSSVLGKVIPHAYGQPTQPIEVTSKLLLVDDIEELEGANDVD